MKPAVRMKHITSEHAIFIQVASELQKCKIFWKEIRTKDVQCTNGHALDKNSLHHKVERKKKKFIIGNLWNSTFKWKYCVSVTATIYQPHYNVYCSCCHYVYGTRPTMQNVVRRMFRSAHAPTHFCWASDKETMRQAHSLFLVGLCVNVFT